LIYHEIQVILKSDTLTRIKVSFLV